ncbi:hypothetical protein U9M48_041471 [Paspalum notatum var. saurae]|uniref:Calmodulin binding protein-like N-terminal domain-containing protein n=1 Tax=Paspalum notatum var. saurae TaxID=547442 RepID=A0AAQ3UP52_PASNO
MALAEENTTTSNKLDRIWDRLGNIEQILRSNSEPQTVCLRSMCELLQKLVTNSMQEKKIQGGHLMNMGEGQVSSKEALLLQGSTPPTPSLRMEQQPYRLVIEGVVGTKKENSDEYCVTRGKEISIKVTITKLDGTPVQGDDPHASATVELVVLPGSFYDPKVVTRWDKEAFEKSKNSLHGMTVENRIFQLTDGSAVHGLAKIMKNSGKREVKLGVMIHEGNMSVGERRVFEGVSNPFKVKEPPRPPKNPEKRATDSIAKEECKRYITETSTHRSTNGQHVYNNNTHPHLTTAPLAVPQGPAQSTNLLLGSQKQMASSQTTISPAPQHGSLSKQKQSRNDASFHPTTLLAVPQAPAQNTQVFIGSQIQKTSLHSAIAPTPQHGEQQYNNNTPLHPTTTPLGQQQSSSNTPLHLTSTPLAGPEGLSQSVRQFQGPHMHMLVSHLATATTPHGGHDGTGEQLSHATRSIGPTQSAQLISRSQVQMASSHSTITHAPHGDDLNGSDATKLVLEALREFEVRLSVPTESQGTEPQSDQEELLVKTLQQMITMQPGNDTGDQNQPGPPFANQDEVVGTYDDCPSQNTEWQPDHQASTLQAPDQTMSGAYDSLQHRMGGPADLSEQYRGFMEFGDTHMNTEVLQFLNLTNPNKLNELMQVKQRL